MRKQKKIEPTKEIKKSRSRIIRFIREWRALKSGRNFDPDFYMKANQDFRFFKRMPYLHFILFGKYEARPACEGYINSFSTFRRYRYKTNQSKVKAQFKIKGFKQTPFISVLMYVDDTTSMEGLTASIKSVMSQWYKHFGLCIALDSNIDARVLKRVEQICGDSHTIIKNATSIHDAYQSATGDYLALMRAGDTLTPDALFACASQINRSDADLIYSDDDKICDKGYCDPHYKPDFSYEMLLSNNYIGNFAVLKKDAIYQIDKLLDKALGKAIQYDLYLKVIEKTSKIAHIPKVLYHKQIKDEVLPENNTILQCTDKSYQTAIKNHLKRTGRNATVKPGLLSGSYQVREIISDKPMVSIIIPFKDKIEYLEHCIQSILKKTEYENFEIIAVSNNSEEKQTEERIKTIKKWDKRIKFFAHNIPFNYSKINNDAVKNFAKGEYILLLNNDIVVLSSGWLKDLLSFTVVDGVGAVGAKLCYPNDTIQSAGVGLGIRNYIGEFHKFFSRDSDGYFGRLKIDHNVSGLSAACMMIKKEKFMEVHGFDEENFAVSLNDLDLCFRLIKNGYRNVLCPSVELYHYESLSRTRVLGEREAREKARLIAIYQEWIDRGDPYYNPNFDQKLENFSIR